MPGVAFTITDGTNSVSPDISPEVSGFETKPVLSTASQFAAGNTHILYYEKRWGLSGVVSGNNIAAVRSALDAIKTFSGRAVDITLAGILSVTRANALLGYPRIEVDEEGFGSAPQYANYGVYRLSVFTIEPRVVADSVYENEFTIQVEYEAESNASEIVTIRKSGTVRTKSGVSALLTAQAANLDGYQVRHYNPATGAQETFTVDYASTGLTDWEFPSGRNGRVTVTDPLTDTIASYEHVAKKRRFQMSGAVDGIPRRSLSTRAEKGKISRTAVVSVKVDNLDAKLATAKNVCESFANNMIDRSEWTSETRDEDYSAGTYTLTVESEDTEIGSDLSIEETLEVSGGERGTYITPLCGDQRPKKRKGGYQAIEVKLRGSLVSTRYYSRENMIAKLAASYGQPPANLNREAGEHFVSLPQPKNFDVGQVGGDEQKTVIRSYLYEYRLTWVYTGAADDMPPMFSHARVDPRQVLGMPTGVP